MSAFANSEGGIIIYGILEVNHVADSISHFDGNRLRKETLEQIIDNIDPKIGGIIIDPIRIDGKIEQSVYVVKIPKSSHAPHKSSKGLFYKRDNFRARIMDTIELKEMFIKTQIINEGVFNKQELVCLRINPPTITGNPTVFIGGVLSAYNVQIAFNIENIGLQTETAYKVEINIPKNAVLGSQNHLQLSFATYHKTNGMIYSIYSIPSDSPLYPKEKLIVGTAVLRLNKFSFQSIVENPIRMILYYSSGREEYNFLLSDYLPYALGNQQINNNRPRQLNDTDRKLIISDFEGNS